VKISLCLPVKGRSRWLQQALFSVLLQGHENYELVIQDCDEKNPVTENAEVRRVFDLFNGRVSVRVERDLGIFDGVNRALARATGSIMYFMCSDDLICPGALEAVNDFFERERFGGPTWIYGQTVSADVTGRTLGIDGEQVSYERLLRGNCIGQPSVFWSRAMMDLAGVFDLRYRHAADYDLWLRMWRYVEPTFLNQTLGVHRHHDAQNTRVNSQATELEAQKISLRHQTLAPVMQRARNVWQCRKAYGGSYDSSLLDRGI
jgi:glycosyltransferase involved in cell wall biosynthesis